MHNTLPLPCKEGGRGIVLTEALVVQGRQRIVAVLLAIDLQLLFKAFVGVGRGHIGVCLCSLLAVRSDREECGSVISVDTSGGAGQPPQQQQNDKDGLRPVLILEGIVPLVEISPCKLGGGDECSNDLFSRDEPRTFCLLQSDISSNCLVVVTRTATLGQKSFINFSHHFLSRYSPFIRFDSLIRVKC